MTSGKDWKKNMSSVIDLRCDQHCQGGTGGLTSRNKPRALCCGLIFLIQRGTSVSSHSMHPAVGKADVGREM